MWLHKLGITESENCSVCNELETIEHSLLLVGEL